MSNLLMRRLTYNVLQIIDVEQMFPWFERLKVAERLRLRRELSSMHSITFDPKIHVTLAINMEF